VFINLYVSATGGTVTGAAFELGGTATWSAPFAWLGNTGTGATMALTFPQNSGSPAYFQVASSIGAGTTLSYQTHGEVVISGTGTLTVLAALTSGSNTLNVVTGSYMIARAL
jgi:hypothetical protein